KVESLHVCNGLLEASPSGLIRVVAVMKVQLDFSKAAADELAERNQIGIEGLFGRIEPGVLPGAAVRIAVPSRDLWILRDPLLHDRVVRAGLEMVGEEKEYVDG